MKGLRYPRLMRLDQTPGGDVLVFVEEGGVRIDNLGTFSPQEVARLTRYLAVARAVGT